MFIKVIKVINMSYLMESWLANIPIAHRGLHDGSKPENSMPAFRAAIKHGYPIELDIQLSADGVITVFHDYNLKRMTGRDRLMKDVSSDELSSLFLAGTKHSIPTLQQVLELVDGSVPLLIDIKSAEISARLENILCLQLKHYNGEFAILSFNPFTILKIKRHCPDFIIGQLSRKITSKSFWKDLLFSDARLKSITNPDFLAYNIHDIPNKATDKAKSDGLLLLAWTIKNDIERQKAERYCDNFIFDHIRP
jgi:glycerophosphoryl diester phosphodiesterase